MAEDEEQFLDSESGEDEENSAEEEPEVEQAKALVEEALGSNTAESTAKDVQPPDKPEEDIKPAKDVSKNTNIVEEKEEMPEDEFLNDEEPVEDFMQDDEPDEGASNEEQSEQEASKETTEVKEVLKDEKPVAPAVEDEKPEPDQPKPSTEEPAAESSWDEEEEQQKEDEEEEESSDAADSKPHQQRSKERKVALSETQTQIYVGNLSWDCTKKDLRVYFQPYGEIHEVVLPRMKRKRNDEWVLVPEGWAFVRFATHEQAKKALKGRGGMLLKRKVKVNLRNPSRLKERPPDVRTIYVSNLNYDATEKDLLEHFGKVGKITDIRLQKTHASARKNNVGFGHIDFADPKSVDKAIKELNGKPMLERSVRIDWAAGGAAEKESKKVPANCKTVRITNVPKRCGRQAVMRLVTSKVGQCFVRFMRKGFNRGCFVDFKTNQQVKAALTAKMNLAGVNLRVCWAPEQESYWVNPKYASADRIAFVMPVNLKATEDDVSKAMSKFGKIKHIVIEPHTKAAHCYIIFKEATAAKAAIEAQKVTILEGDRKSDIKEYIKSDGKRLKRALGSFSKSYSCAISNLPYSSTKKAFVNLCDKLIKGKEFSLLWKMKKEKFRGVVELVFDQRADANNASKEFKKQTVCGRELVSVVVKKNGDLWKNSVEDLEAIRKLPQDTPSKKRGKNKRKSTPSKEKSAKKRKTEKNTSTAPKEKKRERGADKSETKEEKPLKKRK